MFHLTRTIWPVGHGAFYTEYLYSRNMDKPVSIVYDCGGKSDGIISNKIDSFLSNLPKDGQTDKPIVDYLCISHFHKDHVNGLCHILEKGCVKCLILPQFSLEAMAEAFVYNAFNVGRAHSCDVSSDAQSYIYTSATNGRYASLDDATAIIEVAPSQRGEQFLDVIDVEKYGNRTIRSGVGVVVLQVDVLDENSGTMIPQRWILVPVNLDSSVVNYNKLLDGLNDLAHDNGLNLVCDGNHQVNWENLKNLLKAAKPSDVHKCYEASYGKNNAYSMPVYSGWENPTFVYEKDCFVRGFGEYDDEFWFMMHRGYGWHPLRDRRQFQCLYMGDFETSSKFDMLKGQLSRWWTEIGLQQIPHHVSDNNHDESLYLGLHKICFGNVDDAHDKSFCWSILRSIFRCGCSPWIVTEKGRRLVQEIELYF